MNQIDLRIVKIRKPHHCWGCKKLFNPGESLELCKTSDGGEITNTYWCESCQEKISQFEQWELEDGFGYGELIEHWRDKTGGKS